MAQDEDSKILPEVQESAEVFLEEYTDRFQDVFFDALRQKSIQNYDRAINLFLEAYAINNSPVLKHELAKTYALDKQWLKAQEAALDALNADPENYWYLDTLVSIVNAQSSTLDALSGTYPEENKRLQQNLAQIYYKNGAYIKAKEVLATLPENNFKSDLTAKIEVVLKKRVANIAQTKVSASVVRNSDPVATLKLNLAQQIKLKNSGLVLLQAENAVETYPLQPFFYYAYGWALQNKGNNYKAIEILETGLDYLFDDIALANKIYQTLADAYTALHNTAKANLYLSKIKPGF
ncbi:tetratricopeptide repeat protein [Croceivirga sp. JEA036]|uniref:tetratricopeptide repeat protein n=1 Tax=Croceivirga sp. JEA036 TaxID=2721162 RepID=UPI00143B134E|nr:hypothetical protein [Croceivirga sp. JEA036]NJB37116.1 hypothetical protein [Croceivirga sp. JEA036]